MNQQTENKVTLPFHNINYKQSKIYFLFCLFLLIFHLKFLFQMMTSCFFFCASNFVYIDSKCELTDWEKRPHHSLDQTGSQNGK